MGRMDEGPTLMRRLNEQFRRMMRDEYGGDAIEYALVAGLIVILFLGAFVQMTNGVGNTFNTIEASVDS